MKFIILVRYSKIKIHFGHYIYCSLWNMNLFHASLVFLTLSLISSPIKSFTNSFILFSLYSNKGFSFSLCPDCTIEFFMFWHSLNTALIFSNCSDVFYWKLYKYLSNSTRIFFVSSGGRFEKSDLDSFILSNKCWM